MSDTEYIIATLMDEQHMSQAELCRRTGVSTSSLSRYLAGDDMPASRLKAIADVLGVTTDRLLGIEEEVAAGEDELVDIYRTLDVRDRKRLLAFARTMQD